MKKIALLGRSGAGKSTVAKIISDQLNIKHLKTGSICRKIAKELLGSDSKDNTQRIDDALTAIDPSIFLNATIRNNSSSENGYVIDSLRQRSDYDIAKLRGVYLVRVICSDDERRIRLSKRNQIFSDKSEKHMSEISLDNVLVDYELDNSKSEEDLISEISLILGKM